MAPPKKLLMDPYVVAVMTTRGERPGGRWYWRARRSEGGKQITDWTGWGTRDEARAAVAELLHEGEVADEDEGEVRTIRQLLGYWLGHQKQRTDLAPRSLLAIEGRTPHLDRELGDVGLDRVTSATLDGYRDRRIRGGAASRTVRLELRHLRAAWRWGRETRLHDERELPSTRIKIEDRRARPTPKRRDLAAVLSHLDRWALRGVLLLAGTGCRRGEIASLEWSRVHLAEEVIEVRGKTGYRAVPLPGPLVDLLEAVPAEERVGLVLGVRPATVASGLRRHMIEACRAAGVPPFSPQALRRYVTTTLLGAGIPTAIEAKLVGHSAEVAQRDYLAVDSDGRREAIQTARLGYLDEVAREARPPRRPRRGPA